MHYVGNMFIFNNDEYFRMYGCNMNHHHGQNFTKHWSEVQKNQKLFIN